MKLKLMLPAIFLSVILLVFLLKDIILLNRDTGTKTGVIVAENNSYPDKASEAETGSDTDIDSDKDTDTDNTADTGDKQDTANKLQTGRDDINSVIVSSDMAEYAPEDYYTDWQDQDPQYIKLMGSSILLSGAGARVKGSAVTILSPGIYVISGHLDDGQIVVSLNDGGTVQIVLDGADISSTGGAPVYINKADKAVISLMEGTKNRISQKYSYKTFSKKIKKAAIYSSADLTINGTGTGTVYADHSSGIISEGTLKITGGNITVNALENGITGFDMLAANGGTINIKAAGNGMVSTNNTDNSKGLIVLDGGSYSISAGVSGIQAENTLLITGGDYTIKSNGLINKKESDSLKAASNLTINGGTFNLTAPDDTLSSGNSLSVNDGSFLLDARNRGMNAVRSITVTGGIIDINRSRTGMESRQITLLDGSIRIEADTDGIALTGNGNQAGSGKITGRNPGSEVINSNINDYLTVNGGYLYVDSKGNSMNKNGYLFMSNGTVILNGSAGPNNSFQNTGHNISGAFEISGGLFIASGSAGTLEPSGHFSQCALVYDFPTVQRAKQLIHLENGTGNSLLTFAPRQDYGSVIISTPDLKQKETYSVLQGGTNTGSKTDGLYEGGSYHGGNNKVIYTQSDMITRLSGSTGINRGG